MQANESSPSKKKKCLSSQLFAPQHIQCLGLQKSKNLMVYINILMLTIMSRFKANSLSKENVGSTIS